MAITIPSFSVSSVITGSANSTIVGTYPSGSVSGDLLIALLCSNDQLSNSSLSASGWTQHTENYTTVSGNTNMHISVLSAAYTGANNLTFTIGADTRDDQLYILRVSGDYDITTPIISVQAIGGGFVTNVVSPSATSTVDNSLLVCFAAAKNGSSSAADDTGQPTGMTIIANRRARALSTSVRSAAAYKLLASAASSGTQTWEAFTSSSQYASTTSFIINHAASAQTITSINSGAGITPGSTGNTATHTGFSGVPTAMTFGGKAATNIAGNATSSTFDFPYYVDLETYPQPGTSPNFIATLGAETATLAAPLNYPAGMTGVTVSSPDTTNDKKLGYWILQAGRTLSNDDIFVYTIADATGSPDSGFTAASPITTVIWHWVQSTGVMYQYNATITEAGITEATGLTVRGLTVSGLSMRGLSVRGIGGAAAMIGGFPYLLPFLLS